MLEELTREDLLSAVDAIVADLLEAANVSEPPVDALDLARRHLGMALDENDRARPDRRQWIVAQEIGDLLKPRVLEHLGLPPEQTRALLGESVANLFAFRLLAPTPWFTDAARLCGYDLLELQSRFHTAGHEVLAWRLLDLNEPCIISVLDNGSIMRRKGNAFRPPKTLARAELACLEHVHEYSEPFEVSADGWRVQGWPVHTVDWRREILRSVVDEDALAGTYLE